MELFKSKEKKISEVTNNWDLYGVKILVKNNYVPKNYFNCHEEFDFDEVIPIVNVEFYGEIYEISTSFVYLELDDEDIEKISSYGDPSQMGDYSDPIHTFRSINEILYPVSPNCEIYLLTDEEYNKFVIEWPNPEKGLDNIDKFNYADEDVFHIESSKDSEDPEVPYVFVSANPTLRERCLGFRVGDKIEILKEYSAGNIRTGDMGIISAIHDSTHFEGLTFYINMEKPLRRKQFMFIDQEWTEMKYVLEDGYGIILESVNMKDVKLIEKGVEY